LLLRRAFFILRIPSIGIRMWDDDQSAAAQGSAKRPDLFSAPQKEQT